MHPQLLFQLSALVRLARDHLFALALAAALAFSLWLALRSAYFGWTWYRPIPHWDHWAAVGDYLTYLDGKFTLEKLFAQHNEHGLVTSRPFFILDGMFAGLQGWLCVAIIYASLLGVACVMAKETVRGERSPWAWVVAAGILTAFVWSVAQEEVLPWAFQLSWPFVHGFGLLALVALARAAIPSDCAVLWLLAACSFSFLTVFSFGNGVLLGAAAVALLVWIRRWNWRAAAFLAVHGIWVGLYFYGYRKPLADGTANFDATVLDYVFFVFTYLGTPFRDGRIAYAWYGLASLSAFGGLALWATHRAVFRRQVIDTPVAILLALALFVVLGAAATAYGRASGGPLAATPSRYATPALILIGALLAIGWRLGRAQALWRWAVLAVAVLAIAATNLPLSNTFHWRYAANLRDQAAFALAIGVRMPEAILLIYPTPRAIAASLDRLTEVGLANFDPDVTIYRPPLQALSRAKLQSLPACRLELDPETTVVAEAAQLVGRIAPPWQRSKVSWILAFDHLERLVGYTRPVYFRPGLVRPPNDNAAEMNLFVNRTRIADEGQPLSLVAFVEHRAPGSAPVACRAPYRLPPR